MAGQLRRHGRSKRIQRPGDCRRLQLLNDLGRGAHITEPYAGNAQRFGQRAGNADSLADIMANGAAGAIIDKSLIHRQRSALSDNTLANAEHFVAAECVTHSGVPSGRRFAEKSSHRSGRFPSQTLPPCRMPSPFSNQNRIPEQEMRRQAMTAFFCHR